MKGGEAVRYLSICSGIEAASVAFHRLGWTPVGFSEIEPFPSRVLAHRYGSNMPGEPFATNGVPNFGDFTTIVPSLLGPVDLLVGGTPCQAFSVAGKRLSLADARGNLSLYFAVLANELARSNGLRWAVWENVPGVLSMPDNAFGCFLSALVGGDAPLLPSAKPRAGRSTSLWRWHPGGRWPVLDDEGVETGEFAEREPGHSPRWPDAGLVAGPWARATWRVLDAQYCGLAQRRRRVFVVVGFGDGADPAAVLFERKGLLRHPPARGQARQGSPVDASRGARASGRTGGRDDAAGGPADPALAMEVAQAYDVANCLTQRMHKGINTTLDEGQTPIIVADREAVAVAVRGRDGGAEIEVGDDVSFALRASQGGSDKAHVLAPIAFDARQETIHSEHVSGPLNSSEPQSQAVAYAIQERANSQTLKNGPQGAGFKEGVAYTLEGRPKVQAVAYAEPLGVAHTLRGDGFDASEDGSGRGTPLVPVVGFTCKDHGQDAGEDLSPTLRSMTHAGSHENGGGQVAVASPMAVRRLTPRECERLQGFPDDWTLIPVGRKLAADGPRYKALGNSMAVPVMFWIGSRIATFDKGEGKAND